MNTMTKLGAVCAAVLWACATPGFGADTNRFPEIKSALRDELYELAQQQVERCLKGALSDADRCEAVLLKVQVLHGLKRYPEMQTLLTTQRAVCGSTLADGYDFWLAMAWFDQGQWAKVVEGLQGFERQYAQSAYLPRVLRLRAWAHMRMGNWAAAVDALTRYDETYAQLADAALNRLDLSRALSAAGRKTEARTVLERVLAAKPDRRIDQEARIALGRLDMEGGQYDTARQVLQPLLDQKNVPDELRVTALDTLVAIAEKQTNLVEAVACLDKGQDALTAPEWKSQVSRIRGNLFLKMGKVDEGIAQIRVFVVAQSTNAAASRVQLELAQLLLAKGIHDRALNEFQNYLETFTDPAGLVQAGQGKGWALAGLQRYQEAAAAFEKAASHATRPYESALCWFKMGDCFMASEQYKLALDAYAKIVSRFPETPLADQAEYQSAECRLRQGELAAAESAFRALADKDETDPLAARALLRVAEIKRKQRQWPEARMICAQVLKQYRGEYQADAMHGMGVVDYETGDYAPARDRFETVIKTFPESSVADASRYMLGWCLFMQGREDEAVRQFREFVKTTPRSMWAADALFWLGERDYNNGRSASAEETFLAVAHDYPQSTHADSALFWAGRAALMAKEYRRANEHLARLIKDYPSSTLRAETRYYQGESLCELGEFASAILIFDEIIKQSVDATLAERALFRKGDCQFTLGSEDAKRYEEALASYQQIVDHAVVDSPARLHAEYKIGRCYEKIGRRLDAFEFYMKVVNEFLKAPVRRPQSVVYFTRAAFNAAGMKEDEKSWRKAVNIYQHIVDADVPAARDAQERIERIRNDHWLFFY